MPLSNIHRDVGVSGTTGTRERRAWHQLNARLAGGDTLVVVAIDRIGRTWQDTVRSICEPAGPWRQYPLPGGDGGAVDPLPGSRRRKSRGLFGQVLVMFAAWVADQELQSIKRRTREGLERAASRGRSWGRPGS